jgi:hypothetical protein
VTTTRIEDDLLAAADLASTLGHPVYDCLYLATALRESTHVVTADGRFHAAVEQSPTLKALSGCSNWARTLSTAHTPASVIAGRQCRRPIGRNP